MNSGRTGVFHKARQIFNWREREAEEEPDGLDMYNSKPIQIRTKQGDAYYACVSCQCWMQMLLIQVAKGPSIA